MFIQDLEGFRYSIACLGKLYKQRQRDAAETAWADDLREELVADTDALIRKIERDVVEYAVAHASDFLSDSAEASGNLNGAHTEAPDASHDAQPLQRAA